MDRITSRANPLLSHIRRLSSDAAYRRQSGQFVGDSPKLLREALQWGVEPVCVVCTEGVALPTLTEGVRVVCVPGDVMASVSPMKSPQGVLFTGRIPALAPPEKLTGRRYVALEGVQDPGNVGAVLRTLDAFDGDGLFLLPGCADPYSPKTLRASMGALFRRPVWSCSASELCRLLQRSGLPLYGAALRLDTLDARTVDLTRAAVAIGSEGRGLSQELLALCDGTVRIPMSPRCESLNAAVAASVLLWEGYRVSDGRE